MEDVCYLICPEKVPIAARSGRFRTLFILLENPRPLPYRCQGLYVGIKELQTLSNLEQSRIKGLRLHSMQAVVAGAPDASASALGLPDSAKNPLFFCVSTSPSNCSFVSCGLPPKHIPSRSLSGAPTHSLHHLHRALPIPVSIITEPAPVRLRPTGWHTQLLPPTV